MHYEINVSLNGTHFFATHKRSITNANDLKKVYKPMAEAFTEDKGYKITVTMYEELGYQQRMNEDGTLQSKG